MLIRKRKKLALEYLYNKRTSCMLYEEGNDMEYFVQQGQDLIWLTKGEMLVSSP